MARPYTPMLLALLCMTSLAAGKEGGCNDKDIEDDKVVLLQVDTKSKEVKDRKLESAPQQELNGQAPASGKELGDAVKDKTGAEKKYAFNDKFYDMVFPISVAAGGGVTGLSMLEGTDLLSAVDKIAQQSPGKPSFGFTLNAALPPPQEQATGELLDDLVEAESDIPYLGMRVFNLQSTTAEPGPYQCAGQPRVNSTYQSQLEFLDCVRKDPESNTGTVLVRAVLLEQADEAAMLTAIAQINELGRLLGGDPRIRLVVSPHTRTRLTEMARKHRIDWVHWMAGPAFGIFVEFHICHCINTRSRTGMTVHDCTGDGWTVPIFC